MKHIPSLDGLRAVSIALVVVSHGSLSIYLQYKESLGRIGSILQSTTMVGHLGVQTFFVISGFLILTLLLREETVDLKGFYFRRLLRIFPPFYFYLFVLFVANMFGFLNVTPNNFAAALTYTTNYFLENKGDVWVVGHIWSLSVEEQFYLLLPALLLLTGKRFVWLIAFALLACPLWRIYLTHTDPDTKVVFSTFGAVADTLAAGCLLAILRDRLHLKDWYIKMLGSKLFLVFPVFVFFVDWLSHFSHLYSKMFYVSAMISAQGLCIALCIDRVITFPHGRVGKILNSKPFVFVGAISYSLYLWQQPFLDPETALPLYLKLTLAVVAALGSYYLVERQFLKFRRR